MSAILLTSYQQALFGTSRSELTPDQLRKKLDARRVLITSLAIDVVLKQILEERLMQEYKNILQMHQPANVTVVTMTPLPCRQMQSADRKRLLDK
jgi:hypothetical protein